MKTEVVKLDRIITDAANVRKHSPRNLEAIKGSLARFGQQKPILVDAENVVIAGNGTVEAARLLGWDSLRVVQSELNGVDRAAYAIADNRTTDLSNFDEEELATVLAELQKDETIDELVTGFNQEEIEELIANSMEPPKAKPKDEPTIEEAYQVVIECESEEQQCEVYDRLSDEGYKCRVLTL